MDKVFSLGTSNVHQNMYQKNMKIVLDNRKITLIVTLTSLTLICMHKL